MFEDVDQMKTHLRSIVSSHGVNGVIHALRTMQFGSRIIMLIELSKIVQEHKLIIPGFKGYVAEEIITVDGLTEAYSYSLKIFENKKRIPLAIKKGIAQAFNNFTADQFAAYEGEIKLSDLLRFVHPEPKNEEMSFVFKKILDGTIKNGQS